VAAMRRVDPAARIGLALDCRYAVPASEDHEDVAATRHFDGFRNRWFFDPVFGKGYPADMVETFADRIPEGLIRDGDIDEIAAPIDHLGLNFYTSQRVDAEHREQEHPEEEPGPSPTPGHTEMGWRIDPEALTAFLRRIDEEWGPAEIMVTENGASYGDGPGTDGRIHDRRRIDYIADHVAAVEAARAEGVPVTGYFVWSFMDNLEWAQGFDQRFGLVWVDHDTGRRVPKDSFAWYRELIS
jgi:beta-glucosidase